MCELNEAATGYAGAANCFRPQRSSPVDIELKLKSNVHLFGLIR